jgi:hypothetical protein
MPDQSRDVVLPRKNGRGPTVTIVGCPAALKAWAENDKTKAAYAEVETVLGCDFSEIIDTYGDEYGHLRVDDVLEPARRGLRGREALDAALHAQAPVSSNARLSAQSEGRHRSARPRSVRRRVSRSRTSRGSPDRPRSDNEGEPPDVSTFGGFVVASFRMAVHEQRRLAARRVTP